MAIDTGTSNRNNNDHVLSFDGTMLGISDQSAGQSAIYTLPAAGLPAGARSAKAGTPKRITPLTPSYLHGWSPDGKWLVYTGGRNGEFDIYTIASDGSGTEQNMTKSKGLDDGPEFSPDGKFIYFNSARSGTMQMWRMKADGSEPEQITKDEWNNWFPHVSPDGQWIAFISFPKEVDPADHPVLQARLSAADAGRRRDAEGHRLRLRRPGHDQRAVLVTRREDAGVREQHRPLLNVWRIATALAAAVIVVGALSLAPSIAAGGLLYPERRTVAAAIPAACTNRDFEGDGVTLRGWHCTATGKRRGTVVYLHGIADNRGSSAGAVDRFTRKGFDVVAYDSRRHGDSGGDVCTYGFLEKRDLRRVVDGLPPGPVVLMGTSLGAAVALQEAAGDPRITAVIAAEVFSDLRTVATERAPWFLPPPVIRKAFQVAEQRGGFLVDAVSPMEAARAIRAPVLLIHGADDRETPPAHSQRIFEALPARAACCWCRAPGTTSRSTRRRCGWISSGGLRSRWNSSIGGWRWWTGGRLQASVSILRFAGAIAGLPRPRTACRRDLVCSDLAAGRSPRQCSTV